jgi:microcystin-dependent protein
MSFTYAPLEGISVPTNGGTIVTTWGDQVNANMDYFYAAMPIGVCLPYAPSLAAPNSLWHVLDGSAVSRTTYSVLFGLMGTTYGVGNGTTTFNLPDCRSRIPIGAATTSGSGLTARGLAAIGGEENHVLITAELAAHNHAVVDPTHTHGNNNATHTHGINDPSHGHIGLFNTAGGTGGIAVEYSVSTFGPVAASPSDSNFTYETTSGSWQIGNAVTGVSVQAASPGISVSSASTGVSTSNAGSGTGHNTMQPWIGMNWIIKFL